MSTTAHELAGAIAEIFTGSAATLVDPYPRYRELQATGPVHWLDGETMGAPWRNAWHVLGYDQTAMALKDRRLGAHRMSAPHASPEPLSAAQRDLAELSRIFGLTLLYLEPPDHTRLRLLTAQTFTRRIGEGLRPQMHVLVDDLLERVEGQGAFDVVMDLAIPLPNQVVAELLGIPPEDRAAFGRRTGGIMTLRPTPQAMANALDLVRYFRDLVPKRRRNPGDDLLSDLLRAQAEDDALTDDEVIAQCVTVAIAGTETTTAGIATGVLTVLQRPAIWETVRDETVGDVVEELLRFDGPTHLLPREAHEDLELGGNVIRAGERLWLWVAAANRDPARFIDADQFIAGRREARHLAFGSGIHACIGAALARFELQSSLLRLCERYPRLRLLSPDVTWSANPAVRRPDRLMVTWT